MKNPVTATYLYEKGWHSTGLKIGHEEVWHKTDHRGTFALLYNRTAQRVSSIERVKSE
jgi:hypothetical protein